MNNSHPHGTNRLNSAPRGRSSHYPQSVAGQQNAEQTILLTADSKPSFAWLIMIKGDEPGRLFNLNKEGTLIGRNRKCQIALPKDKAASKEHARVYQENNQFMIDDLASSNKTWVNEQEVYHYALKENDLITIGQTRFVFKQIRDEELDGTR